MERDARKTYKETKAAAKSAYKEVLLISGNAEKEYWEATAGAWNAYQRTIHVGGAESQGMAVKTYAEATVEAWKVYSEAMGRLSRGAEGTHKK